MKRCPQCQCHKELAEFSIRKSGNPYGWCKVCSVKKSQQRYAQPEVKEAKKLYDKARHAANPSIAKRSRLARENKNPGVRSREAAAWSAKNPSRRRAIALAYKSRRRAAESAGMSGPEFRDWLSRRAEECHWCGSGCSEIYHVDHVMPLSKGGAHEAWNLVVSCQPCNQKKSNKHPIEWLSEIGYNPCALPQSREKC